MVTSRALRWATWRQHSLSWTRAQRGWPSGHSRVRRREQGEAEDTASTKLLQAKRGGASGHWAPTLWQPHPQALQVTLSHRQQEACEQDPDPRPACAQRAYAKAEKESDVGLAHTQLVGRGRSRWNFKDSWAVTLEKKALKKHSHVSPGGVCKEVRGKIMGHDQKFGNNLAVQQEGNQ